MRVEGITWHAITLDPARFAATRTLVEQTFGLRPSVARDGFMAFAMPDGSILELYSPQAVPSFGYNDDLAFGFRVDDLEAASRAVEAAGYELLDPITRIPDTGYSYRHFRGPDGRVYGLNEQKARRRWRFLR